MAELRLDAAVALRRLARSRTQAASLIARGLVRVDGTPIIKPSVRVSDSSEIIVERAEPYVSRGAHKLIAALNAFDSIRVKGITAFDVGASTGGFTQVLLERGAERVIALDVGHKQLDSEIGRDERVRTVEGFNIRAITRESCALMVGSDPWPALVVGDVSFISLTYVLPPLFGAVGPEADYVLLIKPQFEVGPTGIREGIVREAELRAQAVRNVLSAAWNVGLGTAGLISSPIVGGRGNYEYLVWFSTSAGQNPTEWMNTIPTLVGE